MQNLDFTGTSYLGATNNEYFLNIIRESISEYGVNFGGSRLNNSVPGIYSETESFLCDAMQIPSALIVSSGTLGGVFIANYFRNLNNTKVFVSTDLHPALKENFKVFTEFQSLGNLYFLLKKEQDSIQKIVFLNTVNPVTLDKVNRESLKLFEDIDNLIFVFDDSHGIGVFGEKGWGISEELSKFKLKYVVLASLAKAFSIRGGVIAGDKKIVESIRNTAMWGGASPPPAFYYDTFLKVQNFYDEQRKILLSNINYFQNKIKTQTTLSYIQGFPVIVNKGKPFSEYLFKNGMRISAFRYPTKNDPLSERIVINANHSFYDLDTIISKIMDV